MLQWAIRRRYHLSKNELRRHLGAGNIPGTGLAGVAVMEAVRSDLIPELATFF